MTQRNNYLNQILSTLENPKSASPFFIVFDLDSTLLDVSPRTQAILDEFSQICGNKFKQECLKLQTTMAMKTDWGIDSILDRIGLLDKSTEFYATLKNFWHEKFFHNDYLKYDKPYPGATEFVKKAHSLKAQIFYLTGRDQHRMGLGTELSLKKLGFPLDSKNAQLILKPHKSISDPIFKSDWINQKIQDPHEEFWFFENEPINIQPIYEKQKSIKIIIFNSTHSGKLNHQPDLPIIEDYHWKK